MHVLVGDPLPRGGQSGEAAGGGVGEEVELLDSVDVGRHGDGRAAEEGRAPARQEGGDLGGPQSLVDGPGPWVPVGWEIKIAIIRSDFRIIICHWCFP